MSLLTQEEIDLNKKLAELLVTKNASSVPLTRQKEKYELAAQALEEHAMCNIYTGPSTGGQMFAGWPLQKLVELAPRGMQQVLLVQILRRNAHMANGISGGPGNGGAHGHGGGGAGGGGSIAVNVGGATPATSNRPHSLRTMLGMRMRWSPVGELTGLAHVDMHEMGETVHIWIITKNAKSVVLEDDAAMFPSDTLVCKIKLLEG